MTPLYSNKVLCIGVCLSVSVRHIDRTSDKHQFRLHATYLGILTLLLVLSTSVGLCAIKNVAKTSFFLMKKSPL